MTRGGSGQGDTKGTLGNGGGCTGVRDGKSLEDEGGNGRSTKQKRWSDIVKGQYPEKAFRRANTVTRQKGALKK